MTEDWFEEAEEYFEKGNHIFSTRHFSKKLIDEVKRLRDFAEQVDAGLLEKDEQIESLTKERDRYKNKLINLGELDDE